MRTVLVTSVALAAVLALPAFAASAAPRAYHAYASQSRMAPSFAPSYAQEPSAQYYATDRDTVTFGNQIVGRDPDPNIRTQLRRDPVPSDY